MIVNFEKWLKENSITEIECLVPDLGGIARGKIIPTKKFVQGLKDDTHRLPQSIFIQTISGGYATEDEEELPHDVYNPTDIDVILRPDFNTIRVVPWYDDPTAQVICDAVSLNNNPTFEFGPLSPDRAFAICFNSINIFLSCFVVG